MFDDEECAFREERPVYDGVQVLFKFANGRGASVIRHRYSYGGEFGLWELAVLNRDGGLDYSTPITDDVLGRLNESEVRSALASIRALPPEGE